MKPSSAAWSARLTTAGTGDGGRRPAAAPHRAPDGPDDPRSRRGPSRGRGEDGVAMMMVILVMLVVTALLVVVTTAVVQRIKPTQLLTKNTATLSAADTGLDAALSQIRSAAAAPDVSGKVFGAPSALPCTINGAVSAPVSAPVSGVPGGGVGASGAASRAGFTYAVTITYFTQDPTGHDTAWKAANQITCTPGDGVPATPRYAVLTSRGYGPAVPGFADANIGDRVLEAVYAFKVTNANLAGGFMWTFGQGFCIQADSATTGSTLTYVAASGCTHSQPLQLFQWDSDYRIRLSSTTAAGSTPLCITGVFTGAADATLQECSTTRYDQLLGYEGGARFRGQNDTNTDTSANCLWSGSTSTSELAGLRLQSGDGCWSTNDPRGSWAPEPKFGAGGASYATHQIVNYQQFGRCFDITGENINATYEILYPCKQDPSGRGGFLWNHKIYYDKTVTSPQPITVITDDGVTHCLTTPSSTRAQPAFPRMRPCAAGSTRQQWTRTEAVTGNYAASYTFTDAYGRCLGIGPQEVWADGTRTPWSTITVAPCDGGGAQKWNAPADAVEASVTGLREGVRGAP